MWKKGGQRKEEQVNTGGTVDFGAKGWQDKTRNNTRLSKMRESLYRTKSSIKKRSLYVIVLLPDRPPYYVENYKDPDEQLEIHEWWAENTVDFLNEVQLIWGLLCDNNEEWAKVCMQSHKQEGVGYPKGVKYMWKASRETKPKVLPVDVYVDHVTFWCNSQVENEDIFPTEEEMPFPSDFKRHLQKMFQRMFRIFAIIYANPELCERKEVENTSLEMCFKHFCYFGWKWGLLDPRETKSIDTVTAPIKSKFEREQVKYLAKELPIDE